jgi:Reverse transcriptase (RNA-dependent DNA polymerase)
MVIQASGFSERLINWIYFLVLHGSSQVLVNSVAGRKIILKRGVRQGDSMSPYIFNIVIDFLARWISLMEKVRLLHAPFQNCRMCLLYADDALVFLQPQEQQLRLFKVIMQLFHQLSGLKVNLQKSAILVTLDHP